MKLSSRRIDRLAKRRGVRQARREKKFWAMRKRNLEAMPHTIREWCRDTLANFEAEGIVAGAVLPRPPMTEGALWRVVFIGSDKIQCAECGETMADTHAHYTVFRIGATKWLSASCTPCHEARAPLSA